MPYFQERFENRKITQRLADTTSTCWIDSVDSRSYRSSPHKKAVSFYEVPDLVADPYAYFLSTQEEKKYHARLRERGLKPQGFPDRGHTWDFERTILAGTRISGKKGTQAVSGLWMVPTGSISSLNGVHSGGFFKPPPAPSGLDKFAQTAYARTAPTAVVFDAAQFLGELREGLPSLLFFQGLKKGNSFFKGLGGDYLNVEFGWKPFISDIMNAVKVLTSTTQTLAQNMDKRVHRKYGLPPVTNAADLNLLVGLNMVAVDNGGPNRIAPYTTSTSVGYRANALVRKTITTTRWFEGEFTSFLPLGFDPSDFFQRASVLTNTKVTPSVLWELSPWSWLVDWFLKIQDSIAANELVANDRLVMHYGYAMQQSVMTLSANFSFQSAQNGFSSWEDTPPLGGGFFQTTITKSRLRANPYGFKVGGLTSLTSNQAAILGALGLSKGFK